jgi:hypothetical protein
MHRAGGRDAARLICAPYRELQPVLEGVSVWHSAGLSSAVLAR